MAILIFIAKFLASSALLYGYYHLFLRNKRFHRYNRFYLLAIALLAIVIPFVNIPVGLFWNNPQHSTFIRTLRVINANGWEEPVTVYASRNQWSKWFNLQTGLIIIYAAGLITGLVMLIRSLAWISSLKNRYTYEIIHQLKMYSTTEPGTPFSFFRSIFWDKQISLRDQQGQQIFRHEMFHVQEKHSADILLLEILCCIGWFNPFYHLIKKELKAIHEFLADEYAVSGNNRYEYAELLVLHAINNTAPSISHPFFHNQIKRRITMITQSNLVRRSGYISRIMALPLLFLLVSAFAVKLTNKAAASSLKPYAAKNITVVIDAGHGGIYPGAHAKNGIVEKDINLAISQKIKELGNQYNISVILTRNSDELVGNASSLKEDLQNRVTITNESKASLFLSVHVNMGLTDQSPAGFEAYISRRNKNIKAREFASALLTSIKSIYDVNEIIKQRDEGIMVIDKTTCPAVLVECGNMDNSKDAAFISNPGNQEKIARKILEGIVQYSNAQPNGTTASNGINAGNNDTISAEAMSKLNIDDIKSISADMTKNSVSIFFKNGGVKYANAKEVNEYYTQHQLEGNPAGYHAGVNMKDSVAEIVFTKDTVPVNSYNKIFTKVEQEADFPGGQEAWKKYLFKAIYYPQVAVDKAIKGTVVVQFIVDENGKLSDVKAISGPKELRAESIRVIKESGNWISAMQNGHKVKAYKRQPITYKLERQG